MSWPGNECIVWSCLRLYPGQEKNALLDHTCFISSPGNKVIAWSCIRLCPSQEINVSFDHACVFALARKRMHRSTMHVLYPYQKNKSIACSCMRLCPGQEWMYHLIIHAFMSWTGNECFIWSCIHYVLTKKLIMHAIYPGQEMNVSLDHACVYVLTRKWMYCFIIHVFMSWQGNECNTWSCNLFMS